MNKMPLCQYSVIYADPPWDYELYSPKGREKSPHKHYQCMTLDQMMAMRDDVVWATAPNSVCVMWSTFAHLPQALALMAAWGFQYKTGAPWIKRTPTGKPTFGTGYVLRNAAELFLIGAYGRPVIKNRSTRGLILTGDWPESIEDIDAVTIDTVRREHSRKPDEVIDLIEALFEGPYLELFARTERPGWDVFGNETTKFNEVAA